MARGGWHGYRQLSSYATMKQQLLARDTFLSAAFRMLPLFPALGESFDHMRVCIIHQMASEDESALIEEDLTTSALNLLEMVLSSSEAACHEVVAPRNFSLWARFRKILLGNRNFQAQSACLVVLQLVTLENVGPSEAETLLARYDLLTVLFEHLGFHQPEEVTTEILRSIELLCAVPSQAFKRSVDVGMANLLAVAGRAVHDGHSNLLLQWYRCIECLLHPSRNGVRDIDSVAEAAALGLTYHHDPEVLESCWHALLVILNDTERRSIKAEAAMYQSLKMLKVCERSVIAHEGAMLNFLACLSTILDRYEPTSELCQEVLQGIKDSVVPRVMESSGGVSLATFGGLMGILGLAFSKEPTFGKGYAEAALRSGSLGTCSEEMDDASTANILIPEH
ncbi:hypothetical protein T484DRAFT_1779857 [Baffinella frigidus]|nr:hypothetical protein T484DRAFT_1779857 [Cryptophyta sp. CCMP2293]